MINAVNGDLLSENPMQGRDADGQGVYARAEAGRPRRACGPGTDCAVAFFSLSGRHRLSLCSNFEIIAIIKFAWLFFVVLNKFLMRMGPHPQQKKNPQVIEKEMTREQRLAEERIIAQV